MIMKKTLLYLGLMLLVLPLGGCSLDDDDSNFEYTYLNIVNVDLPDSFELNRIYPIKVTYVRPDNCTYFEGFDVSKDPEGTTNRTVAVVGSVLTDKDCEATDDEVSTAFNFEVLYDQDYHFKFLSGKDSDGNPTFIEVTVPVETQEESQP